MIIAIPSKGRAGKTTSQKVLPNSTFYVPKSEEHQYKQFVKNIIAVPNDIQGITKTRNWILKNTSERRVVFIDDDVKICGYKEIDNDKMKDIEIKDEGFWVNEFKLLFDIVEDLGWKIWGLKTESAPRSVYPYKPFMIKTYITASCMGIINDGTYLFDENFKVKEDYEIGLRHLKEYGGVLGCRYIHWENDHWKTDGGCKDYRTIEMEKDVIKRLIKLYPGMIQRAKRKNNQFTIELT